MQRTGLDYSVDSNYYKTNTVVHMKIKLKLFKFDLNIRSEQAIVDNALKMIKI